MNSSIDLKSMGLLFQASADLKTCNYKLLDQTLLPSEEKWLSLETTEQLIEAIQSLRVRGAPLIGVAASLGLAQAAIQGASQSELLMKSMALFQARPTAVNLMNCISVMKAVIQESFSKEAVVRAAVSIFNEDVQLCEKMGNNGASLFSDGDSILTHCNTGGLATVGIGTALGVIRKAFEQGKKIHVYVDETRPLLQGGRLTSWELQRLNIPMTLISDNMAAHLMKMGKITKAIVGSDRIAANGDFANKIGTYSVAVNCHYHKIPFFVAAPFTTVDPDCPHGDSIPIEQRKANEVLGASGSFGSVQWAPKGTPAENPAFDVTPAELVSGWILDRGVYKISDVKNGVFARRAK